MEQTTLAPEIRGVLIPLTDASVLLPNACVSEVITYGDPMPAEDAPEWVLGLVTWRGWRMPLFSYAKMVGRAEEEETSGAKVAILKAFGGIHKMPYMALLAQGFPRLTAIRSENLLFDGDQEDLPEGVLYKVQINDEDALIPDLNGIERHLLQLIYHDETEDEEGEDDA
ncbi:MAG: chemotaxis protein CheW [Xanthomonadales bacterium]|nr:chemotaxis protein CheW [Xanthomonadales bacterium]